MHSMQKQKGHGGFVFKVFLKSTLPRLEEAEARAAEAEAAQEPRPTQHHGTQVARILLPGNYFKICLNII